MKEGGPFANVNRPTDFGGSETDEAWLVFDTYRRCADPIPHAAYIGIHGPSVWGRARRAVARAIGGR